MLYSGDEQRRKWKGDINETKETKTKKTWHDKPREKKKRTELLTIIVQY